MDQFIVFGKYEHTWAGYFPWGVFGSRGSGISGGGGFPRALTYQFISAEKFLSSRRQVDDIDRRFPAEWVPPDSGLQGPSDDLMAEANANHSDLGL